MFLVVCTEDLDEAIPLLVGFLLGFSELCVELLDRLLEARNFIF